MAYHKLEKNELQCYLCQKEFEHKGGLELHLKVICSLVVFLHAAYFAHYVTLKHILTVNMS